MGQKKKFSLVSWDKICNIMSKERLGIQDPKKMNVAYGAKLWWQWINDVNLP